MTTGRLEEHHPATLDVPSEASAGRSIRQTDATGADEGEANPMAHHPGIEERRDRNGRIRYRVRVRRNDSTLAATLPTLAEALSWRSRALDAADGLADPPQAPQRVSVAPEPPGRAITLSDAARRFSRGMLDGTARTRDGRAYGRVTAETYERVLRRLVLPVYGGVPVATLARGDVQRLVSDVAGRVSVEHARHVRAALAAVMRQCEDFGEVETSPCIGIRVERAHDDHGDAEPALVLTPAEGEALLTAAEADDERRGRSFIGPFVRLGLASGLRRGELLALPWGTEGLDLDRGLVHVRRSLAATRDRATGTYPFQPPKSRKSRRDVPLPVGDVTALRRHRLASGRPVDGALVFADESGRPLGPGGKLRASWRRATLAALGACSLCGARHADWRDDDRCAHKLAPLPSPHDLRHTYASHMLRAGRTARAVADLLGHSDASLVLRRYAHTLPDELAGAADALDAWRATML